MPTIAMTPKMKMEFYKDIVGEWRCRFVHANGNVLMVTSEGYNRLADCLDTIEGIWKSMIESAGYDSTGYKIDLSIT